MAARITAENEKGRSAPSEVADTVTQVSQPVKMAVPTIVSKTGNSVTLSWQEVPGSKYELLWAQGSDDFTTLALSDVTSFIASDLSQITRYKFKVRASNACGFGPASEELLVTFADMPSPMTAVKTTKERCSLRIDWSKPASDGGTPITEYKVEVASNDGTYHRVLRCGKDVKATSCLLNMRTFFIPPFNLNGGNLIEVRVSAANALGFGKASPVNTTGVAMIAKPPTMDAPELVSKTVTSAVIRWKPVRDDTGSGIIYTLLKAEGDGPFKRLRRLFDSSYKVRNLEKGKTYRFKIRAANFCRAGEYSSPLGLTMDLDLPAQMAKPSAVVDQCTLRLGWVAPDDGRSPIQKYRIEVRGKDKVYRALPLCGEEADALTCDVPLNTLGAEPYNLETGDVLAVRAAAANAFGWSPDSAVNASTKVILAPKALAMPELAGETADSIQITWKPASKVPGTKYEVHWDEQVDGQYTKLVETEQTTYTATKVEGQRSYRFKVLARNVCGSSPLSPELKVSIVFAPAKVAAVQLEAEACSVRVSWDEPDNRGAPTEKYAVEIKGAEGDWFPVNSCGSKPAPTECLIPMATLEAEPFNLKEKAPIVAAVAAYNAKGWGLRSDANSDGVLLKTAPPALTVPRLVSVKRDKASFEWDVGATGASYEISVDNTKEQFQVQTEDTSFTFTQQAGIRDYKFAVRAANECGFGPLSP